MSARSAVTSPRVSSEDWFASFYRANLPTVYGYLLRLSGGERALAEDLTQDTWVALSEELVRGRTERADIRWLLTVARSRYLDHVRRVAVGRRRLQLVRPPGAGEDGDGGAGGGGGELDSALLEVVSQMEATHRVVLLLRYVEELSVLNRGGRRPIGDGDQLSARSSAHRPAPTDRGCPCVTSATSMWLPIRGSPTIWSDGSEPGCAALVRRPSWP